MTSSMTSPKHLDVGQFGQFGYTSFDDQKQNLIKALRDEATSKMQSFCVNFAMLANVKGWKWRGKDVTLADVCSTYGALVNTLVDNINNITDDDIMGTKWHTSASTGRINITVLYYVNMRSIQVFITAQIDD